MPYHQASSGRVCPNEQASKLHAEPLAQLPKRQLPGCSQRLPHLHHHHIIHLRELCFIKPVDNTGVSSAFRECTAAGSSSRQHGRLQRQQWQRRQGNAARSIGPLLALYHTARDDISAAGHALPHACWRDDRRPLAAACELPALTCSLDAPSCCSCYPSCCHKAALSSWVMGESESETSVCSERA